MGLIDKLKEYAGFDDPGEVLAKNWRASMQNQKPPTKIPPSVAPDNYIPHYGPADKKEVPFKTDKKKKRKFSTA